MLLQVLTIVLKFFLVDTAYRKHYAGLTQIPSDIPSSETIVSLSSNRISSINGTLNNLHNLKSLLLSNNEFTSFPNLTAVGATLITLDLRLNQITTIANGDTAGLHVIQRLYISMNGLITFPDLSPIGSTLKFLYVSRNDFTTINKVLLEDLVVISMIDISSNQLTLFPDFEDINDTLDTLKMGSCQISDIPFDFLNQLIVLEDVNFDNNLLTEFPDAPGPGNTLKYLHLDSSLLPSVPYLPLMGRNIRHLYLHDNPITHVPPTVLQPLDSLQKLILDGSHLTQISHFTPLVTDTLEQLHLSTISNPSPISKVGAQALQSMNEVDDVYMENTQLTSLPPTCFDQPTTLYLKNTPLDLCTCELVWLKIAAGHGLTPDVTDVMCPGTTTMWSLLSVDELSGVCHWNSKLARGRTGMSFNNSSKFQCSLY